jgi:hypothetical protein
MIDLKKIIFVVVKVADLDLVVPPESINMFTREDTKDVSTGEDLTIDEMFSIYSDEAGYFRKRDGVLHKCYPMYVRKFNGFQPAVLEIHDNLEDFGFDVEPIEEMKGGQDETE